MNKILSALIVSILCFILPSCGDDKEKDEPTAPTTNKIELLLIGEWSRNESSSASYYRMVFLEDRTGYDKAMHSGSYDIDETFKWTVNGSTLKIIWESSDSESFTIVNVDANELILRSLKDADRFIYFTRV